MPDIARSLHDMDTDRAWLADDLQDRFLRYVRVHTTSDPHNPATPSTDRQFDLARMLEGELRDLGLDDVTLDDHCNLVARLPGTASGTPIGFMAHLDTAPDFSGEGVDPQVHEGYDGGVIELDDEHALDPEEYPTLACYEGETVITTDGTTLLGADDKAGIAEIMTAVKYLLAHPELPRPDLEVIFTPDEETGRGMETFPVDELRSKFCLTVDGTDEGGIEAECFTAFKATVTFTGYSIHPGKRARQARERGVDGLAPSSRCCLDPRAPRRPTSVTASTVPPRSPARSREAQATVIVRDFDMAIAERRLVLPRLARADGRGRLPRREVEVETTRQYVNMAEFLKPHPELLERMQEAIAGPGWSPWCIRSAAAPTEHARLSEKGVPTPNLFTGGQNLHGRYEWIASRRWCARRRAS